MERVEYGTDGYLYKLSLSSGIEYKEQIPIEAIPKDQYEARLKSDMVAMLENLKSEIRENYAYDLSNENCVDNYEDFEHNQLVEDIQLFIQKKIDKLREGKL